MRCFCYRVDQPSLMVALTDEAVLTRYQNALSDELPSLADRGLVRAASDRTLPVRLP
jgi:hypothetical protein